MRFLLLSDVHANFEALKAVVRDAGAVDEVWCAGDLVDYGTSPHEVIQWFAARQTRCVSGNHDRHLLQVWKSDEVCAFRGTRQWKWIHDNCERISDEDAAYLQARPIHISFIADDIVYLMQHQMGDGELAYQMPESVQVFDNLWERWYGGASADGRERRIIFGHTHRRCVHQLDNDRMWINPGSISYRRPDDHDKRAHYMIIDNGHISFHAVDYDRSPSLNRAMTYLHTGTMMETELQDAMFFFGNAATPRDPLPTA